MGIGNNSGFMGLYLLIVFIYLRVIFIYLIFIYNKDILNYIYFYL